MEPVMGAYAHLVAFDDTRSGFAHLHPMETDLAQRPTDAPPTLNSRSPFRGGPLRDLAQVNLAGARCSRHFGSSRAVTGCGRGTRNDQAIVILSVAKNPLDFEGRQVAEIKLDSSRRSDDNHWSQRGVSVRAMGANDFGHDARTPVERRRRDAVSAASWPKSLASHRSHETPR